MKLVYNFKPFQFSSHRRIIELTEPNKKVLDIGCSSGYLGSKLKLKNCHIIGIDKNRLALKGAKKHYQRVFFLDLEKDMIRGKFDVIILGDIIEHLSKPDEFLKKLKRNLNKNGYILISVPNIVNIVARIKIILGKFEYQEKGIFDRDHLRFFTLKSFKQLVRDSGYSLVCFKVAPIPIFLAFPRIPKYLLTPLYYLLNILSNIYPPLFAYQFIAKIV